MGLDGFSNGKISQKLSGLEGKRLVSILAQAWGRNESKGENALERGIVGAGENQGITAQHRLDIGEKGHDGNFTTRPGDEVINW